MEHIFAVEFSVFEPDNYHIVGFDFDPDYPETKEYFAEMERRSKHINKCCLEEAIQNGNISGITWEGVLEDNKGIATVCNNHIFRTMLKKVLLSGKSIWNGLTQTLDIKGLNMILDLSLKI